MGGADKLGSPGDGIRGIVESMALSNPDQAKTQPLVLVTGGAQRIGQCIALHLAAQGWAVAVHYRSSAAEALATVASIKQHGGTAQAFAADLADEAACEALLPSVAAAMGPVAAVVNNASLFSFDDVATFSYANMDRHWRANTAPAVVLARALHAQLAAETTGVVVNLLDQKLWNPNPDYVSYTFSKAALEAATTLLAQALAPRLRVCGVAPGVTLLSGEMSGAEFAASHQMTPLQRSSSPADIAHAVHYLLHAQAVTGTTLLVDGGQHLQAQSRDVMFLARDVPQ